MTFASVRRAIPWKMIVLGTVAEFIMRPARVPCRLATWGGRPSHVGAIEKTRAFGDSAERCRLKNGTFAEVSEITSPNTVKCAQAGSRLRTLPGRARLTIPITASMTLDARSHRGILFIAATLAIQLIPVPLHSDGNPSRLHIRMWIDI